MSPSFISRLLALGSRATALHSTVRQFKHFAIAFRGGHIIKVAANKRVEGLSDVFSLHAEEALLLKLRKINALRRYKDVEVFLGRSGPFGFILSAPCHNCEELLKQAGIKRVYYTGVDGIEYKGWL